MGSLFLLVILVFVVLFTIAVTAVIADLKAQRQKDIEEES
jgi:hypothetical protein